MNAGPSLSKRAGVGDMRPLTTVWISGTLLPKGLRGAFDWVCRLAPISNRDVGGGSSRSAGGGDHRFTSGCQAIPRYIRLSAPPCTLPRMVDEHEITSRDFAGRRGPPRRAGPDPRGLRVGASVFLIVVEKTTADKDRVHAMPEEEIEMRRPTPRVHGLHNVRAPGLRI